uniref:DNA polymerase iota n=1 Tax=Sphenodon punctatus TaxID=8508 RepID=A0A8D0HK86_SPHPU
WDSAGMKPKQLGGGSRGCNSAYGAASHGKAWLVGTAPHRVIVHTDLDCFYAQVEMLHNPELRGKPLCVQQKYLVVTCNYEARELGVKKLMSVKEANEKCPQLVLVNGEDLTKYREMSYKVTALLEEFSPLVERLGFDENFVDITEMVGKRLEQLQRDGSSKVAVSGHVYNNQAIDLDDTVHVRLVLGSQIAAEMREAMHSRLALTGCAGVASNKLLSKLVSGTFKPNQQTVLLPESCQDLIGSLDHIKKVPGIGYKTTKRLELLGVRTMCELQTFPPPLLEKELGVSVAQRIQKLSYGEDDSPVTPSGPPQSLSDEDSFKKCSSEGEVKKKIEELLANLLDRLDKDGRKPHTVRLTLRQFFPTNKWFTRESRQCPIPSHIIQKLGTGNCDVMSPLVDILMKLFHKMINVEMPFHLTLLNVCFSNLKAPPTHTKGSIGFYLTRVSPSSSSGQPALVSSGFKLCNFLPGDSTAAFESSLESQGCAQQPGIHDFPLHLLPAGIDQDIFIQLPRDIKEEIIFGKTRDRTPADEVLSQPFPSSGRALSISTQQQTSNSSPYSRGVNQNVRSVTFSKHFTVDATSSLRGDVQESTSSCILQEPLNYSENVLMSDSVGEAPMDVESTDPTVSNLQTQHFAEAHVVEKQKQPLGAPFQDEELGDATFIFPPNVDPKTFSELPTEVQKELLAEWKNRESPYHVGWGRRLADARCVLGKRPRT